MFDALYVFTISADNDTHQYGGVLFSIWILSGIVFA